MESRWLCTKCSTTDNTQSVCCIQGIAIAIGIHHFVRNIFGRPENETSGFMKSPLYAISCRLVTHEILNLSVNSMDNGIHSWSFFDFYNFMMTGQFPIQIRPTFTDTVGRWPHFFPWNLIFVRHHIELSSSHIEYLHTAWIQFATHKNINFLFHFPCLACVKFEFHHQPNVLEARTHVLNKNHAPHCWEISVLRLLCISSNRFDTFVRCSACGDGRAENVVEALKLPVIVATTSVHTQTRAPNRVCHSPFMSGEFAELLWIVRKRFYLSGFDVICHVLRQWNGWIKCSNSQS